MEQEKIARINALARKAKGEGLTETEKKEQQQLRKQYIDEMKASLRAQLDNVYIVNEQGEEVKLGKKDEAEHPEGKTKLHAPGCTCGCGHDHHHTH